MSPSATDHSIRYKTHKRLGTVQEWIDDSIDAYGKMMARFVAPAPCRVLRQAVHSVLYCEQILYGPGEHEVYKPSEGEVTVRIKGCLHLRKQRDIAEKRELGFDGRGICDGDKLGVMSPNDPSMRIGIVPVETTWQETGCMWRFRAK